MLLKTNVSKGKTFVLNHMSACLKSNPVYGAHFDDKFITFGVASCIMIPDLIFHMALVLGISC